MQIFIYCKATLHVSSVTAPIIRSIKNCTRSLRYRSYYLYRYFPPTWSDRDWSRSDQVGGPEGYRTPCIQPDLVLSDTQNKQSTHTHKGRTQIIRYTVSEFLETNLKIVFNNSFNRCKGCLIVEDNFHHLLKHAVKLYCTLQTDNVDSISAFRLQLDVLYTEHTKAPD